MTELKVAGIVARDEEEGDTVGIEGALLNPNAAVAFRFGARPDPAAISPS